MKKALVLGCILGVVLSAWAADPVVCMVNVGTGAATSTALSTDGGACPWLPGSTVLQQCTVDVYARPRHGVGAADRLLLEPRPVPVLPRQHRAAHLDPRGQRERGLHLHALAAQEAVLRHAVSRAHPRAGPGLA
jgi:hypothetical protein